MKTILCLVGILFIFASFAVLRPAASQVDTTPPVIDSLAVSGITTNAATVTWATDEPADGRIQYGPTPLYSKSILNTAFTTAHRFALTGLSANRVYHYRVHSRDA